MLPAVPVIVSVCPETAVVTAPAPAILSVLPMLMSMVVLSSLATPKVASLRLIRIESSSMCVSVSALGMLSATTVVVDADLVTNLALFGII
jgi:hypothetical protein